MFDRMVPLVDATPRMAPLTIRIAEVPSLFSEGPEPEPESQAARWAAFARVALRLLSPPRTSLPQGEVHAVRPVVRQ